MYYISRNLTYYTAVVSHIPVKDGSADVKQNSVQALVLEDLLEHLEAVGVHIKLEVVI